MTYTALTFSSERYTLWNTRSAYHNLPIIGGLEQREGAKYCAQRFEADETGASAELQNAYPEEAGVTLFRRELSVGEYAVVSDSLELQAATEVTWDKLGENCQHYLAKGRKVAVVGPVSVSSYEAKDGSGTRFTLEVRADDVEFLSSRQDDQNGAPYEGEPAANRGGAKKEAGFGEVDDDDLPF